MWLVIPKCSQSLSTSYYIRRKSRIYFNEKEKIFSKGEKFALKNIDRLLTENEWDIIKMLSKKHQTIN